ncbi:hypothetical protein KJ807_05570 [Patescibacteria group bacterium]|nr:hypothetical protein [Patescibacteria group bacterium]
MDRIDQATVYGALSGAVVSVMTPRRPKEYVDKHIDSGIRMHDMWPLVGMVAGGLAGGYIVAYLFPNMGAVFAGLTGGTLGGLIVLLNSVELPEVKHFFW